MGGAAKNQHGAPAAPNHQCGKLPTREREKEREILSGTILYNGGFRALPGDCLGDASVSLASVYRCICIALVSIDPSTARLYLNLGCTRAHAHVHTRHTRKFSTLCTRLLQSHLPTRLQTRSRCQAQSWGTHLLTMGEKPLSF